MLDQSEECSAEVALLVAKDKTGEMGKLGMVEVCLVDLQTRALAASVVTPDMLGYADKVHPFVVFLVAENIVVLHAGFDTFQNLYDVFLHANVYGSNVEETGWAVFQKLESSPDFAVVD